MNKVLLNIYYQMLLIRRVQEAIIDNYHPEDKMRCPMHLCVGQELTPSILSILLKRNDSLWSHHRSHGYFLSKKGSLNEMLSEFYGKNTGTNGGLAGSQELSCTKTNFYSGTILSGAFAFAIGDAFAKKYSNSKAITTTVIGEGGMEEGIVFEALNFSSLMKLPVLYICENNRYSVHTEVSERQVNNKIIERVRSFGIESYKINQNDPFNNYKKIKSSIEYIRKYKKPVFIEVSTYRFAPHVGPENDDHWGYRPDKELKSWIKKDPLLKINNHLKTSIRNFEKINNSYEKEIKKLIKKAFNYARLSNFPTEYEKYNLNNSYSPIVKSFYKNEIFTEKDHEYHNPAPY